MIIYKDNNWEVVFCDWYQGFVGYTIISSKKEALSDLTSNEWLSLGLIEKELERICKKLFNSTMFNFACLMNNAYRDNEIPHVHFHFFPRYKNDLNILGKVYKDKYFGSNFWKYADVNPQEDIFTNEERLKIYEMIKNEFKIENTNTVS